MTEIFYRTNGKESYRETEDDWAETCNKARAHLFPDVTQADIAAQSMRADEILNKAKRNGR